METKEKIKKSYTKPLVTQVKLEIQEAILAGCKTGFNENGKASPPKCQNTSCLTSYGS
jgi:hypothetical protein